MWPSGSCFCPEGGGERSRGCGSPGDPSSAHDCFPLPLFIGLVAQPRDPFVVLGTVPKPSTKRLLAASRSLVASREAC